MRASLEVADIFRAAGPAYRATHAGHLSLHQLKVMSAIEHCRTAALGGHVEACEDCGHRRIEAGARFVIGRRVLVDKQAKAGVRFAITTMKTYTRGDMSTFNRLGFNLRLSDIQAAVGVAQMAKLDAVSQTRPRPSSMGLCTVV